MKKQHILSAVALVFSVVLLAGPALAQDRNDSRWDHHPNWNRGGWNAPRFSNGWGRNDRYDRWQRRGGDRTDRWQDRSRFQRRWW